MSDRVVLGGMNVSKEIADLINNEILAEIDVDTTHFWKGFAAIVKDLTPTCQALLKERDRLQLEIDSWHQKNPLAPQKDYHRFLCDIGYLLDEGKDFKITTSNVDPEITSIAGPQLVVPVMNARFAINAANARWGSLYDALYGSNVISDEKGSEAIGAYNPKRGAKVISFAQDFLNGAFPLRSGRHQDVKAYEIKETGESLVVRLQSGKSTQLKDPTAYCGYRGDSKEKCAILLKHHNLHIEIDIDHKDSIGKDSPAGVKDIIIESAITTIQDCEDSVAAVDAADKAIVYRNWLGLMRGDLQTSFEKSGKKFTRKLAQDRHYLSPKGEAFSLPGRSLMLVRNVGHLMTTDAVISEGHEVPEGFLDAMVTAAAAMHDIKGQSLLKNSKTGSIYIVKPKMHGPEEVAFTVTLFKRVEEVLGLPTNTIKIGIMDEERRTTINLKECIRQAQDRIIFINTGFLDRTGDEIHTSMEAGPVVPKGPMKEQAWMNAYEDWNVDVALNCGFQGKAQIGKGMWPKPDQLAEMLEAKINHPKAGANCAWVPSPTAAALHALHYHNVLVDGIQNDLVGQNRAKIEDILAIPLLTDARSLTPEAVQKELDNNIQSILGYVVRWVDQGIGCSKVPDIQDIGLMEDRATLRISSQHIANWLRHDLCSKDQVISTMKKMAAVVDHQNRNDPNYIKMTGSFENSLAFQAGLNLVLQGSIQPNGYTEPVLHQMRKQAKERTASE